MMIIIHLNGNDLKGDLWVKRRGWVDFFVFFVHVVLVAAFRRAQLLLAACVNSIQFNSISSSMNQFFFQQQFKHPMAIFCRFITDDPVGIGAHLHAPS